NSVINNETIINSTLNRENVCMFVDITISFQSDTDRAVEILRHEAENHPETADNRTAEEKKAGLPKVTVRVVNLSEFGQHLRAYVWANSPGTGFVIKTDLFRSVKKRFDAQGIEIPYRTVYVRELPIA
ncbi:MAG TPA: mechanosensitive ion channel family protein, partial [Cyclobacteriaceae bacterium]|nr:mechanosensitive ion channel family protein [Cyclobacteriaceae bacterium]